MKKLDWILVGLLVFGIGVWLSLHFELFENDWRERPASAKTGVEEGLFPWIGAEKPQMVIHEYLDYSCVHCPVAHMELRSMLVDEYDKVRLVRHDYPRVVCSVAGAAYGGCELVRAAICAGEQIDYWKWNDLLIEFPPVAEDRQKTPYIKKMAAKAGIKYADMETCMQRQDVLEKALEISVEAKGRKLGGTPAYLIDDKVVPFNDVAKRLKAL
jgi:protein-disulfide isomerase